MPGRYFTGGAPPMLFVQGSADTINPPWASIQLYRSDRAGPRYYLNLTGASHMAPYAGDNPVERLVARITLAFFARYVLGDAGVLTTMTRLGNSTGIATLSSGGQLESGCPVASAGPQSCADSTAPRAGGTHGKRSGRGIARPLTTFTPSRQL